MGKKAGEITATSSNKKVVKPDCYVKRYAAVIIKKPGTAKLTIKAKVDNKIRKYKCTIKVLKYENPLKTFTIGDKDFTGRFDKKQEVPNFLKQDVTGELQIATKSGWEIKRISYTVADFSKKAKDQFQTKFVQNGDTVTMYSVDNDDLQSDITVDLKNKKLGLVQTLILGDY